MSTDPDYGPATDAADAERIAVQIFAPFGMNAEWAGTWLAGVGADCLRVLRDRPGTGLSRDIAAGAAVYDVGQWFGGRSVSMAAVAAVAVDPGRRGEGLSTKLMRAILCEARAKGVAVSSLYPSTDVPYRRVGYAQAGSAIRWAVPIDELRGDPGPLTARRYAPDDRAALAAGYARWAARRNGQFDRNDWMWGRKLRARDQDAEAWVVARDGVVEGFAAFLQTKRLDGAWFDLDATDFWFTTPDAARALLSSCAGYRSLCEDLHVEAGPADPLWVLAENQGRRVRRLGRWMLRVVDLPAAMSQRGWPTGFTSTLHLRVTDELLPENGGDWILDIADGVAACEPANRVLAEPIQVHAAHLGALYTGERSASDLERDGLCVGSSEALALADAAFAGPAPWMADAF